MRQIVLSAERLAFISSAPPSTISIEPFIYAYARSSSYYEKLFIKLAVHLSAAKPEKVAASSWIQPSLEELQLIFTLVSTRVIPQHLTFAKCIRVNQLVQQHLNSAERAKFFERIRNETRSKAPDAVPSKLPQGDMFPSGN